jgi:uncharacterized membrane protein (UPF0127 family)
MKIINKTKNTVLAEEVIVADTCLKRIKGLLGRKDFRPGQALVIKSCNSIHTFFMNFPIDILFVDKHCRILKAISCLKPYRLSGVCFKANFVIELPAGTVASSSTAKDDAISIE